MRLSKLPNLKCEIPMPKINNNVLKTIKGSEKTMKLTVGKVEELIRPFSKGTEIELSCGYCHHSSIGSENILKLKDHTNQTYGYVEIEVNANSSQGHIELNEDKEQWYKAEIERLKKELENKDTIISQCDELLKLLLSSTIEFNKKWIQRLKDGF